MIGCESCRRHAFLDGNHSFPNASGMLAILVRQLLNFRVACSPQLG